MSTFKVEICKIEEVKTHPDADRLDLIRIKDWWCVTSKDTFKTGDLCVYFPVDSLLPPEVESAIFGIGSKIKLHHSRVKTIKIRKAISQGLAVKAETLGLKAELNLREGDDLTDYLKVKKYQPPVRLSTASNCHQSSKKQSNPNFRKYTDIENAKNYPKLFEDNEDVYVTEKIHGTNFRAGWVAFVPDTFWKKFLQFVGLAPKWEFVYGSHNVQLQNKMLYKGYYDRNVYAEAVKNYDLEKRLDKGQVIYGEIYGDGIQKGYTYGCKPGERKAVFFDLMQDGAWASPDPFFDWANKVKLPTVPILYHGPFNKDLILELRDGDSVLAPTQKVREGVVVKPGKEVVTYAGRKVLKYISDNYLLKNQDDETEAH